MKTKKVVRVLLIAALAFTLLGCTQAKRLSSQPLASDLPNNFTFVANEGNGYFKYRSPDGLFLVSRQKQGNAIGHVLDSNMFIDIVYVGK